MAHARRGSKWNYFEISLVMPAGWTEEKLRREAEQFGEVVDISIQQKKAFLSAEVTYATRSQSRRAFSGLKRLGLRPNYTFANKGIYDGIYVDDVYADIMNRQNNMKCEETDEASPQLLTSCDCVMPQTWRTVVDFRCLDCGATVSYSHQPEGQHRPAITRFSIRQETAVNGPPVTEVYAYLMQTVIRRSSPEKNTGQGWF